MNEASYNWHYSQAAWHRKRAGRWNAGGKGSRWHRLQQLWHLDQIPFGALVHFTIEKYRPLFVKNLQQHNALIRRFKEAS